MSNNMRNNTMLVIGQGFLGQQIAHYFLSRADVKTIDFPDIDITNEASIREALLKYKPGVVINAAAFADTHAAQKPENHRKAFDINVRGPVNLMMFAPEFGYYLVHIGTGMIYNGKAPRQAGFDESDTPNPTSYYAWTKALADACLSPFCQSHRILITRIHLPIASVFSPRNLLTKMTAFDSFATDQTSITVVDDYLQVLEQLIDRESHGIYHIVNKGTFSFYDIGLLLQKHGLIPKDKTLGKTTLAELNIQIAAKGGALQTETILHTGKLEREGIVTRNTTTAIEDCILRYKNESNHGH